MSDDFLRSSPSRIDPLLYSYSDDSKKKLPIHQTINSHSTIHTPESKKLSHKSKSKQRQQSSGLSLTPSIGAQSKINTQQQPEQPEQLQQLPQQSQPPSFPSSASKFYSQFTNLTGWTPLISKTYSNEQIVGFDATPSSNKFLVAQQMGNSYSNNELIDGFSLTPCLNSHTINSIQNQLNNLTPFNEKTLHLADFFIDSPMNQTPIKDLQTITPSKFKMSAPNSAQKIKLLDTTKSATKRSITLVDTPPRLPQKLSILAQNITRAAKDDEGTENGDEDEEEENDDNIQQQQKVTVTVTPKKPLGDITNKPKIEFQTPANQKLHAPSSPSTIVIVSPTKITPETTDEDEDEPKQPPSPTPQNKTLEPRMGIFSERKAGSQPKLKQKTKSKEEKSKTNKAKMQAGMNKFQIIFTDVHTLMNNKSKKPTKKENHNVQSEMLVPPKEVNISKEHSIISHNSMNSSHLNISTDHSSFEIEGNDKFFLDKVFDKQSPSYYSTVPNYGMPPPNHPPPHVQVQQNITQQGPSPTAGPSNPIQQPTNNMMILMSTPQHSNVYTPGIYSEISPYSFGYTQQPKYDKE